MGTKRRAIATDSADTLAPWHPGLRRLLTRAGLDGPAADATAHAVIDDFRAFFGGSSLYVRRAAHSASVAKAKAFHDASKAGKSPREIAALHGVSTSYVYRLLNQARAASARSAPGISVHRATDQLKGQP